MRLEKDVVYGQYEQCVLDAYLPQSNGFTTIIYFHGGGLVAGDKADKNNLELAEALVKEGYAFVSANYRMYIHDAKYPDFLVDAAQAVAFIKENYADKLGNGKVLISGQSAGAWISAMLCMDKQWLAGVGIDAEKIDGWLLDSAQMTSHFRLLEREENITPWLQRIDKYAPVYYVGEGVKVSPMFITFYEKDMLCRVEQNQMFINALRFFNREADVTGHLLPGEHCHGTVFKDEDGQFAFLKLALPWMKERGL
jgi:acetyl esterase/lipase